MNILLIIILLFILFAISFAICNKIESFSNLTADVVYSKKTPYNAIEILDFEKNDYGLDRCLYLNEEVQLCNNEEYKYHEIIVHYPSSYIKDIENVVIIGGGDCMTLREVLKYNKLKSVKMLEIDKDVISVSNKYFKTSSYENDPRVEIIIGDASKTVKELENNHYDLVIIDTTEIGNSNKVIDKLPFYKDLKQKMNNEAILVKNGDNLNCYRYLNSIFKYNKIFKTEYGLLTDFEADDYLFMMFSDKKLDNVKCHNIKKLNYYNCDIHDNFSHF